MEPMDVFKWFQEMKEEELKENKEHFNKTLNNP